MVKRICVLIAAASIVSGCGMKPNSGADSTAKGLSKPGARKHIEPGTDLMFACLDSSNKTTVAFYARWVAKTSSWTINGDEVDQAGRRIREWKNLSGTPDAISIWQMQIYDGGLKVAQISQNGSDDAVFSGGGRSLICKFE